MDLHPWNVSVREVSPVRQLLKVGRTRPCLGQRSDSVLGKGATPREVKLLPAVALKRDDRHKGVAGHPGDASR